MTARDLAEPSPLALEILSARPYAYLDDAPLEERRTQAVIGRRWLDPESAADIGRLDPERSPACSEEAWPQADNADELHDALLWLGCVDRRSEVDAPARRGRALVERARRTTSAVHACLARRSGRTPAELSVVAAERLPEFKLPCIPARISDTFGRELRAEYAQDLDARGGAGRDRARAAGGSGTDDGRGSWPLRSACRWPISIARCSRWRRKASRCAAASLPTGVQLNGASAACWRASTATRSNACAQEIEPVSAARLHALPVRLAARHADERMEGPDAVAAVISQLEGFEAAAAAWEAESPGTRSRLRAGVAGRFVPARARGVDAAGGAATAIRSAATDRVRCAARRSPC